MTDPIAVAKAARMVREWTDKRDALIAEARAKGASLRVLSAQTGLSHGTIDNICKRVMRPAPLDE